MNGVVMATVSKEFYEDVASMMNAHGATCEPSSDYSGRFMFGRQCIGFTTDNTLLLSAVVALAATKHGYNPLDLISAARTDDMGLSSIVYFPDVELSTE